MRIETVGQLRQYLEEKNLSPETLALKVPVSNMTWRRLLRKPDRTPIPEKYADLLEQSLSPPAAAQELDPKKLVCSGFGGTEAEVIDRVLREGNSASDPKILEKEVSQKMRITRMPEELNRLLRELIRQLSSRPSPAQMGLILGGLAYFLNPFDLIADAVIGIGLIDDLGILTLIAAKLSSKGNSL